MTEEAPRNLIVTDNANHSAESHFGINFFLICTHVEIRAYLAPIEAPCRDDDDGVAHSTYNHRTIRLSFFILDIPYTK